METLDAFMTRECSCLAKVVGQCGKGGSSEPKELFCGYMMDSLTSKCSVKGWRLDMHLDFI